jgi:CHAP domain
MLTMTFDRTKPPATKPLETVKPKRADQTQTPGQKVAFVPMTPVQLARARARFDQDTALLQSLRKPKDSTLNGEKPASAINWIERKFSANLMGSDGDRRIDFTLNRIDNKISGSFAIHGTGHGDIRGEYNPEDTKTPLRLECTFTKVVENPDPNKKPDPALLKLVGQTRVLDGWFLYAENGAKKDENNDGKDDSSKSALPLLIGGVWKGGKKEYKLEPITPQATVASNGKVESGRKPQPDGSQSWEDVSPKLKSTLPALKDPSFLPGVEALARRLSVPRDHLLALMMLESSLDPAKDNGQGYYGLIQIGEDARDTIDTYIESKKLRLKKLQRASTVAKLSGVDQLPYIEIHFLEHGIRERIAEFHNGGKPITLEELYMSVLGGNASIAKKAAWKTAPSKGYDNNKGLDGNKDGTITPTEATDAMRLRWRETFGTNLDERSENLERNKDGSISSNEKDVNDAPRNYDPSQAFWEASSEERRKYRNAGMGNWGKVLGEANGIKAYFNAGDGGKQGRNQLMKDGKVEYDYGLKWQCVEFIRRYLYDVKGHAFTDRGHAKEYFNAGIEDGGSHRGLTQYTNDLTQGSQSKPQVHDLIVMSFSDTGHVAIVIDVADDYVTIAQQNVGTQFTETLKLSSVGSGSNKRWKLAEPRVKGWLRKG